MSDSLYCQIPRNHVGAATPHPRGWLRVSFHQFDKWLLVFTIFAYVVFQRGLHKTASFTQFAPSLILLVSIELTTLLVVLK